MKTYHDIKLKSGERVVMARANFTMLLGCQIVEKNNDWNTVKLTVSKDGMAVSSVVKRSMIKSLLRSEIKMAKNKLRDL